MAIVLPKGYATMLDKAYHYATVTDDLNTSPDLIRQGANAKEILYPKINVSGLGAYDRASGYTTGSFDLSWGSAEFDYDRGTKIQVDAVDEQESFNLLLGGGSSELMRTKVGPESDAYTFAKLAAAADVDGTRTGTLADGAAFLGALIAAISAMDEAEVAPELRYLYATATLVNGVMALDTTKSREVLDTFAKVIKVPQSRFYTAIDLLDGVTAGEEAGHFTRAGHGADTWAGATAYSKGDKVRGGNNVYVCTTAGTSGAAAPTWPATGTVTDGAGNLVWTYVGPYGLDINFMVVQKDALAIKADKHVASNVISPELNPNADAHIVKYRKYGLTEVYENKVAGIYLHHKA